MGHRRSEVIHYTPREMSAFLHFARRRQRRDLRLQLTIMTAAARADSDKLQRIFRELDN